MTNPFRPCGAASLPIRGDVGQHLPRPAGQALGCARVPHGAGHADDPGLRRGRPRHPDTDPRGGGCRPRHRPRLGGGERPAARTPRRRMSATAGCRGKGSSSTCRACGARHAARAGHVMQRVRGTSCSACGTRRLSVRSRPAGRALSKSLDKIKATIRSKTGRSRGDSLESVIVDLNWTRRGWFGTFKHAHPPRFSRSGFRDQVFAILDQMIRRRLRSLLMKQDKRSHFGIGLDQSRRWPNAFFAKAGLFALHTNWHVARQSR